MSDKIHPKHLEKHAYVYIRQSTPYQVRNHREGQQRQYALAERARQLGFAQVAVLDEDLGRSGSGTQDRPGFGRLLAAVCQGQVGAVLALEASRLARNQRDWQHLVDLCALTGTLLIDEDGVYDPRLVNDRLLLGLKGSLAEFELGLLRQRAQAARKQKVEKGFVLWEVPVGYVRTESAALEMSPDRQVQEALRGAFAKFRELGSARQVLLWYHDEQIALPHAVPATAGREVAWRLPTGGRILQLLKNPCYAGAFAYGQREARTVVRDGRAHTSQGHRKPLEQWDVLILDHHPGYISWGEYLDNLKVLEGNAAMSSSVNAGAAKGGPALLSGLLRCGRCGRLLRVAYGGSGGRVPRYHCCGGRTLRGSGSCLTVGAGRLDEAVSREVLAALQPLGVEAALGVAARAGQDEDEKRKALTLALEKARYQADRARRQYDAADPENRLVAAELEARWNEALRQVAELEARLAAQAAATPAPSEAEHQRLLVLGSDLEALWNHAGAPAALKKRILRTVLVEIMLDVTGEPPQNRLRLHWAGGAHTELLIPRTGTGRHQRCASGEVLDLVRELAKACDDRTIAAVLNRLGYRTGQGKTWRASRVLGLRHYHGIAAGSREGEWLTLEGAAAELGVSNTLVRRLIQEKALPAQQVVTYAPWLIRRADLELPAVQAAVQAVREGRKRPRTEVGQRELPFK
jgi:DNA invertase Pin-like site-specific DNA recombinase